MLIPNCLVINALRFVFLRFLFYARVYVCAYVCARDSITAKRKLSSKSCNLLGFSQLAYYTTQLIDNQLVAF